MYGNPQYYKDICDWSADQLAPLSAMLDDGVVMRYVAPKLEGGVVVREFGPRYGGGEHSQFVAGVVQDARAKKEATQSSWKCLRCSHIGASLSTCANCKSSRLELIEL